MICTNCKRDKPPEAFLLEKRNIIRLRKSWCRDCCYAWTKVWKAQNKEDLKDYQFAYDLFRNYQMTVAEYNALLKKQDGRCANAKCRRLPHGKGSAGKLHVDHNHVTGQNRALLCLGCNRGIGFFEEDIERMESAIEYLQFHREGLRMSSFE